MQGSATPVLSEKTRRVNSQPPDIINGMNNILVARTLDRSIRDSESSDCAASDTEFSGSSVSEMAPAFLPKSFDVAAGGLNSVLPAAIDSQEEATIHLAAASARREVTRAERRLALCLAQEHDVLTQLYRFRAEKAGMEVTVTEHGIGALRDCIRTRGFQLAAATPMLSSMSGHKRKFTTSN